MGHGWRGGRALLACLLAMTATLGTGTATADHPDDPPHAGWRPTGSLSAARALHQTVRLDTGQVLAIGGLGGGFSAGSTELYSPTSGTWKAGAPMSMARRAFTATKLRDGRVLVAGGDNDWDFGGTQTAELYDPATGEWTPAAPMRDVRRHHAATLLDDGRVLVTGGQESDVEGKRGAEIYDPVEDEWTAAAPTLTTRFRHTLTLLRDGRVLAVGGTNYDVYDETEALAELYDPETGDWTRADGLMNPPRDHTATRLRDGRVVIAAPDSGVETFEPRADAWTFGPYVDHPFAGHTATLLPSGHLLIAGGDPGGVSAKLLDPVSEQWSDVPGATVPRNGGHSATLLASGKVLISGGTGAEAELFGLDRRPPVVREPTLRLPVGGAIDDQGQVPVRLGLRGWDAVTPFASLRWTVTDDWADELSPEAGSVPVLTDEPGRAPVLHAKANRRHAFRTEVKDLAGYTSTAADVQTPISLTPQEYESQESDGWSTVARDGATDGTVLTSTTPGTGVIFTVQSKAAALVVPFREDLGVARICLDPWTEGDRRCYVRDLSPATGLGPRRLLLPFNDLGGRRYEISIAVVRGRVDVDGMALLG